VGLPKLFPSLISIIFAYYNKGSENMITSTSDYNQAAFGQNGYSFASDGGSLTGEFYCFQAMVESVVSATSVKGDSLTSVTIPAGTVVSGDFSSISVTTGSVVAYYQPDYVFPTGPSFDPDYQAVLDYATANAIPLPDDAQKAIHNARLVAWKDAGIWASRDFAFHFENSNADFALIDWKRLVLATAVNSPTYDPNKGFASNGTSSYIILNYTPSGGFWGLNSGGVLAKFDGTTFSGGYATCLGTDVGSTVIVSPYFNTNQAYGRLGEGSLAQASPLSNAQGVRTYSATKNAATRELYLDGVLLNSSVIVPGSSFQPTRTLKYQSTFASINFSISVLLGGGSFSSTQALNFHNSVI
jgi:hypothetical protein